MNTLMIMLSISTYIAFVCCKLHHGLLLLTVPCRILLLQSRTRARRGSVLPFDQLIISQLSLITIRNRIFIALVPTSFVYRRFAGSIFNRSVMAFTVTLFGEAGPILRFSLRFAESRPPLLGRSRKWRF